MSAGELKSRTTASNQPLASDHAQTVYVLHGHAFSIESLFEQVDNMSRI